MPEKTNDYVNSSISQTVESQLNESELYTKLKSETFILHSVRDYKSVLQEDLLSRTNDDKNMDEGESLAVLEPDFIKSIGLK